MRYIAMVSLCAFSMGCGVSFAQIAETSLESAREIGDTAWQVETRREQAEQQSVVAQFYTVSEDGVVTPIQGVTSAQVHLVLDPVRARHQQIRAVLRRATETHARAVDAYNFAMDSDRDFTQALELLSRSRELFREYRRMLDGAEASENEAE